MPPSNAPNQEANLSAFDSILTKYSNLLIEVEKLREENQNIDSGLNNPESNYVTKDSLAELVATVNSALNQIKQELSQLKSSIDKLDKNEKDTPANSQKRKRKSSKRSFWKRFKSTIRKTKLINS